MQLKSEWEKDKSKYYIHTMHSIDENLILQYIAPEDKFWMGEAFVEEYELTIPKIEEVNKFTWEREQPKDENDFAKYGLSIINYNCDPRLFSHMGRMDELYLHCALTSFGSQRKKLMPPTEFHSLILGL